MGLSMRGFGWLGVGAGFADRALLLRYRPAGFCWRCILPLASGGGGSGVFFIGFRQKKSCKKNLKFIPRYKLAKQLYLERRSYDNFYSQLKLISLKAVQIFFFAALFAF